MSFSSGCPYTFNEMKEEIEVLHTSTKKALQKSWNENKMSTLKCKSQEKEIESLRIHLKDAQEAEEKWRQKCKEMNNHMIIMLERTKSKLSIPTRRFSMPFAPRRSRRTVALRQDSDTDTLNSTYGTLKKQVHLSSSVTCDAATTILAGTTIEDTIVNDIASSRIEVRDKKFSSARRIFSDPPHLLMSHDEETHNLTRVNHTQEGNIQSHNSTFSSSTQPVYLHEVMDSYKAKLEARDNEITSLEKIISENIKLIQVMSSEIELSKQDDNVMSDENGDTEDDLSELSFEPNSCV